MLSACGSDDDGGGSDGGSGDVTGDVLVDGSSTVYPMSTRLPSCSAKRPPTSRSPSARPAPVAGSSASAPARPTSPTPLARSTRPTRSPVCADAGIEYTELQVATDALTVVVHPDLEVDCLTTDQLIQLWEPGSTITNWNQLDPTFPDQEISLFGPGTDSGTYDYMAADVIGDESETTRDDYEASEDDNVLVQGVAGTEGATGYFGYTYYEQNRTR